MPVILGKLPEYFNWTLEHWRTLEHWIKCVDLQISTHDRYWGSILKPNYLVGSDILATLLLDSVMEDFLPIAYFEGKFVPFREANVSIATHALHYGTGAFGGLRGWVDEAQPDRALLFRLDRHCQRLSHSARFMHYDLPPSKIENAMIEFIQKNKPTKPLLCLYFLHGPRCRGKLNQ